MPHHWLAMETAKPASRRDGSLSAPLENLFRRRWNQNPNGNVGKMNERSKDFNTYRFKSSCRACVSHVSHYETHVIAKLTHSVEWFRRICRTRHANHNCEIFRHIFWKECWTGVEGRKAQSNWLREQRDYFASRFRDKPKIQLANNWNAASKAYVFLCC